MPKQNQFLTMKFSSDRLKKFKYDINLTLEEAIANNEIIATFENQTIDSILDIKGEESDFNTVEELRKELKRLKSKPHSPTNAKQIKELQSKINNLMFVPEYITIKIIHKSHYRHLFEKGLMVNGVKYRRFNASASQARVNTILCVSETVFDELRRRTDNGRDLSKKLAPAKLNAYRGLYSSSRYKVSRPKFCVVPDYFSETEMTVNYVTETSDWNEDDTVDVRTITKEFNRFDGQGLILPKRAKIWQDELDLDYIPAQFCIRAPFCKGMVCVFDFVEWIEKKNNGNYLIKTIYKDENDNHIYADLREYDMILTESQMKLWDSWKSVEDYNMNCDLNNLSWGVTLFTPKQDKNYFYENYQFLQTLFLNDEDVKKVTDKFVNWVKGVTSENVYYTMLFLLGFEASEDKFLDYINKGETDWIRALILEPNLINDKYIREKVYRLIKKKIENACLGQIIVNGNFQVLISDPYAMMEAICEQDKVEGLLSEGEYYSNYWNQNNVSKVVASRSPLTYRSEHVILDLKKSNETEYWYKYCYTGVILNAHGDDTARFAGSDFDYDIIATTSDETVIKGVYRDELPVVYQEPKAEKKIVEEKDLYKADLFSFNSIIGGLTNKSTTGYALLADLNPDSEEYKVTLRRIKTITKAQSAQIDKTKIGKEVKGIVGKWINYQHPPKDINGSLLPESEEKRKQREFENSIMLNKHPYFFTYLYKNTKKKYKDHLKQYNILCLQKLGMTLDELKMLKRKNTEEEQFLDEFYRNSPVIESDCTMNKICRRIESVDFEIKKLLKSNNKNFFHEMFMSNFDNYDQSRYEEVVKMYQEYRHSVHQIMSNTDKVDKTTYNQEVRNQINVKREEFKSMISNACSNENEALNYLIHLFYVEKPKSNKDALWDIFGKEMVENLKVKKKTITIPVEDNEGDIEYLNRYYSLKEVSI